jgi:hypothetical protein
MSLLRVGSIIIPSGRSVDIVAALAGANVSTVKSVDMATTTPPPSETTFQHDGIVEH